MVDEMQPMLDFYLRQLGFSIATQVPDKGNPFFAIIARDQVRIMLYSREQFAEEIPQFATHARGGTIALYIAVDNIEELYAQLKEKRPIIQPLHQTTYGTTEFSMTDPSGYVLMFTDIR